MKKIICLLLVLMTLISLCSCVSSDLKDALNDLEEVGEIIEEVQDYNENQDSNELEDLPYDDAWWTKPFHLKFEDKSLGGENEYDEIEVIYDGEEIYLKDAYNTYYVKEKGDVTRTYSVFYDTLTYTDSDYEEETVEYELEYNMGNISSIISYIKSVLYVDRELWENIGSEKKEGYDCDIYTEVTPVLQKTKLWIDKDTGILVWREDEPTALLDDEEVSDIYGVQYKLISFENKKVPKATDFFNLDDYGGDPDEAKEKGLAEAKANFPAPPSELTNENYSTYSKIYTAETNWTLDEMKAYIETLRNAGFNLDELEYDFGSIYSFVAFNEEGYKISINWEDNDTGDISFTAPME